MPASTSSNTRVGGAAVSTRRNASMVRASSPPEATLASGSGGVPGLAASRSSTSSPGSSPPTTTSTSALGMASSARWDCTSAASCGAAARRGGAAPRRFGLAGAAGAEAGIELGGPAVVVLELDQPGPEVLALGQHIGQRFAVLAAQVVQQLAALAHLLQPLQLGVLVGTGDGGAVDLAHLVAQEVQLPRPCPLVAAHGGQLVDDAADLLPGGVQRPAVDAAEPVERLPLGGDVQQGLVRVLAMQVHQLGADRRQLAHSRQPAIDVGAAAARAGDRPCQHHLVALTIAPAVAVAASPGAGPNEASFDPRLGGARRPDGVAGAQRPEV